MSEGLDGREDHQGQRAISSGKTELTKVEQAAVNLENDTGPVLMSNVFKGKRR